MRFKVFSALAVLLLAGSSDARPPKDATPEVVVEDSPVATGVKDDSSWRPIEPRGSPVARSDSRYRGREEGGRKLYDNRYRDRFTLGAINSFKTDEDFGLTNDWRFLGAADFSSNISGLGFRSKIVKPEPEVPGRQNSRRSHNDRFSKLHEGLESVGRKSSGQDVRLDDREVLEKMIQKNSSFAARAKNRVVITTGPTIGLKVADANLQPVTLVRKSDRGNGTELKNWPSEAIQDVQDLFNYEKYTSSIEGGISEQSPPLNYGDAPIYSAVKQKKKKKKKKKPTVRPGSNYQSHQIHRPVSSFHEEDVVTHHKISTVSPEAFGSSVTHNREPLMQPNVQEIIQWLQIPAFTSGQNQSHLAHDASTGEPIANSFDKNDDHRPNGPVTPLGTHFESVGSYPGTSEPIHSHVIDLPTVGNYHQSVTSHKPQGSHDKRPGANYQLVLSSDRPLTTLGSFFEPQTNRPDALVTAQSYVEDNPAGSNYYQLVSSQKPNRPSDGHRPTSEKPSGHPDGQDKRPDANYQLVQSSDRPLTTLGSLFEPQTGHPDALVTAQSYVEDNPAGGNYYQLVSSQKPNRPFEIHYPSSEKPSTQLDHHYTPLEKPADHSSNYYQTQTFHPSDSPSYPVTEASRPLDTVNLPTSVVNLLTELANKRPSSNRRPIFRPSSEITQNTVVHILNPGSRRPNVTVNEMKLPQMENPPSTLESNSSAGSPPNVHIMFMNEDVPSSEHEEPTAANEEPQSAYQNPNCPTIMINSITRVNNTIESKEGCSDLNIVIKSQVLSTNVFKPGGPESDDDPQDKYAANVASQENPQDYPASTQDPNSGTSSSSSYFSDETDRDPDGSEQLQDSQPDQDEAADTFTATSEVVSESQVIVNTGSSQEAAFDALGSGIAEEPLASSVSNPVAAVVAPQAAPASVAEPVAAVGQALGAPVAGPVSGAQGLPAIGGISSAASQVPGLASGLGGLGGLGGTGAGSSGSPGSTALATMDDDDDDDDDFDMSPSGLMESMGSVFTYFTFLNPLNYSIFSLAAAPFVAMAAGVIGIATVFFPWTLPGVLGLGRAADKVTIRFRPNLDEVVKQSMYKYRDWHEWKSKRRKRKR